MKRSFMFTAAAIFIATAAQAATLTPKNGETFDAFMDRAGCTVIDMGGYQNVKGPDGGGCAAVAAWSPRSSGEYVDADNDPSTPDIWVSNN